MVRTTFKEVLPLSSPTYADFEDIGRCVHIDDVEEAIDKGFLVPQPITNTHKRLSRKVLWFAPCQSMSSHKYYGNVTFVVKWETARRKMGPNLYLLDQAIYSSRSFTRVVLTKINHDDQLKKVDLRACNSALTESSTGCQHVNYCSNKKEYGPHELQIAIEVDEDDARWLLHNCKVLANDHSCANTPYTGSCMQRKGKFSEYESYMCFKFNTQNVECPYKFTKKKCKKHVLLIILRKMAKMSSVSTRDTEELIRMVDSALYSTSENALEATFKRFLTLPKHQAIIKKLPTSSFKAKTTSFERLAINTRTAENTAPRAVLCPLNSFPTSTKLSEHSAVSKIEKTLSGESSHNASSPRFGTAYSRSENSTYSGNPTKNVQVAQHLVSVSEPSNNPVNTFSKDFSSFPNENVQLRFISAVKQEKAFSNISPTSKGSSAVSFVRQSLPPNATSPLVATTENVKPRTTSPKLLSDYSPTPSQQFASVGLSSQRTTMLRVQAGPDKDQETSSRVFLPAATQRYTAPKLASQNSVSASSHTNSTVASPMNYHHSRTSDRELGGTSSYGHDVFSPSSSDKLQKRPEKLSAVVKEARAAVPVLQSAPTEIPAHKTMTRESSHSVSGVPKYSNYYSIYFSSNNPATDSSPSSYENFSSVSSPESQKFSRLQKTSIINEAPTMSSAYYRTASNASPQKSSLTSNAVPHTNSEAATNSNSGGLTSLRNSVREEYSLSNYGSAQPATPEKRASLSHEVSVSYNGAKGTSAERHFATPRVSSRNTISAMVAAADGYSNGERASDNSSNLTRKNSSSLYVSLLRTLCFLKEVRANLYECDSLEPKVFLKKPVSSKDRPSCPRVAKHSPDFQISGANKYASSTTPSPGNDNLMVSASGNAHQTLSKSVSAASTETDLSRSVSTDRENLSATSAARYSTATNASLHHLQAVTSPRSSTQFPTAKNLPQDWDITTNKFLTHRDDVFVRTVPSKAKEIRSEQLTGSSKKASVSPVTKVVSRQSSTTGLCRSVASNVSKSNHSILPSSTDKNFLVRGTSLKLEARKEECRTSPALYKSAQATLSTRHSSVARDELIKSKPAVRASVNESSAAALSSRYEYQRCKVVKANEVSSSSCSNNVSERVTALKEREAGSRNSSTGVRSMRAVQWPGSSSSSLSLLKTMPLAKGLALTATGRNNAGVNNPLHARKITAPGFPLYRNIISSPVTPHE